MKSKLWHFYNEWLNAAVSCKFHQECSRSHPAFLVNVSARAENKYIREMKAIKSPDQNRERAKLGKGETILKGKKLRKKEEESNLNAKLRTDWSLFKMYGANRMMKSAT